MFKRRVRTDNEISEMISLELGGFPQKVLIEGRRKDLPIMVVLHGGPGQAIPGCGFRGRYKDVTDRFVTVFWDQLGCGINNRKLDSTVTVESYVDMTEDLVAEIGRRFPDNKVFLFASSWGTVLSAKLLERGGHSVDGVVACGQIVRDVFVGDEVKNVLGDAGISEKKMARIRSVTADDCTFNDIKMISGALMRHTDAYRNRKGRNMPLSMMLKLLLTSPDYTLRDAFAAMMVNECRKNRPLFEEIPRIDLTETLKRIEVPYIMVQGDTDAVASTRTVRDVVDSSGNENLEVRIAEDSGHIPTMRMMEMVGAAMDDLVRIIDP